jgi:hypothetical protein
MENITPYNFKLLVNYYKFNPEECDNVINYYNPIGGYLYCLFNPMYKYYGENVKKCGNSIDTDKRKGQYTTSYLEESEYLLISEQFIDKTLAETLLFYYLKDYRIRNSREFFDCDIQNVRDAFEKVKIFFNTHNTKKKLFNYFIKNYNIFNPGDDYKTFNNSLYNLINTKKITSSKDIDFIEFNNINYKLYENITDDEKFSIIKYNFKKFWNLKELDKDTFELYFRCESKLYRLLYLLGKNTKNYEKYADVNIEKKTDVIKNIITTLGFDLNNLNLKIIKDVYSQNILKLFDNVNQFKKNYKDIRILFDKDKHILKDNLKGSALSKLLNGFLNEFGMFIKCKNSTSQNKKKNENKKTIYYYKIDIDVKYNDFIISNDNH